MRIKAIAFAMFLSSVQSLPAQVLKAQILGSVTDQTGALVPGAKVKITDALTNFVREGETNEAGNFFFVNLDPGDKLQAIAPVIAEQQEDAAVDSAAGK